jgi:ketosteroid isomerase-like protein
MRLHSFLPSPDGDKYNNRAIAILELRWGKLVAWEDYEDTERVAAWDRAESTTTG